MVGVRVGESRRPKCGGYESKSRFGCRLDRTLGRIKFISLPPRQTHVTNLVSSVWSRDQLMTILILDLLYFIFLIILLFYCCFCLCVLCIHTIAAIVSDCYDSALLCYLKKWDLEWKFWLRKYPASKDFLAEVCGVGIDPASITFLLGTSQPSCLSFESFSI